MADFREGGHFVPLNRQKHRKNPSWIGLRFCSTVVIFSYYRFCCFIFEILSNCVLCSNTVKPKKNVSNQSSMNALSLKHLYRRSLNNLPYIWLKLSDLHFFAGLLQHVLCKIFVYVNLFDFSFVKEERLWSIFCMLSIFETKKLFVHKVLLETSSWATVTLHFAHI